MTADDIVRECAIWQSAAGGRNQSTGRLEIREYRRVEPKAKGK